MAVVSDASSGHLRRCSDADSRKKDASTLSWPTKIRYGRQQRIWRLSQMPHQVTYDVVATPIRPKNAYAVKTMLLYCHGQQREWGWQSSQMPHQVTYDVVAMPISTSKESVSLAKDA
eukprot:scaffold5438_cov124-Skeletonema_marinoi.AAC.4